MFLKRRILSLVTFKSSLSILLAKSSKSSKTSTIPSCTNNSLDAADCFIIAEPGAKFPFNTAILPLSNKGSLVFLITSCGQSKLFLSIISLKLIPDTVIASKWRNSFISFSILGRPPDLNKSSIYPLPDGFKSTIIGVFFVIWSKSFKFISIPNLPAIAVKWTIPFVEPPIAESIVKAFWKFFIVRKSLGLYDLFAISTAILPVSSAILLLSAETAGAEAPFVTIMPNASVINAIVLAVPITPQVPTVGTSWLLTSLISFSSISSALNFAQYLLQSVHAPTLSPLWDPVSMGPVTNCIAGMSALKAPIIWAGTVLSQPPIKTHASIGWALNISSVSMDIRFLKYIEVGKAKDSCIVIVGNSNGIAPDARIPDFTLLIKSGTFPWQGL